MKYIPIFMKKDPCSTRIEKIIIKNERNIKWNKYPMFKDIMQREDFKKNYDKIYMELTKGLSKDDFKDYFICITSTRLCEGYGSDLVTGIIVIVRKIDRFQFEDKPVYSYKEYPVKINGKKIYFSSHAIERVAERLRVRDKGYKSKERNVWNDLTCIKIGKFISSNMVEVYTEILQNGEGIYDRRIGYFVVAELPEHFVVKTFLPMGYNGTPEHDYLKGKDEFSLTEQSEVEAFYKEFNVVRWEIEKYQKINCVNEYKCISIGWNRVHCHFEFD
jgi:hypothetical protein